MKTVYKSNVKVFNSDFLKEVKENNKDVEFVGYAGVVNTECKINFDIELFDNVWSGGIEPKKNCVLFRYATNTTLAGGYFPLVSVNIRRGLIYFWNEEENCWDTRSLKVRYFNFVDEKSEKYFDFC